ncbi:hypothetical protein SmJEL517_g00903 [Synchytrium microbalum]|uniref:Ribosomal RNA-processing protein 44 n=1 Tax=Synchytrium microbalum TaxID=1806994 RepID=A0A507C7T2_9FUNG|nr:uncharacterized protein SmJEL517_g00903 [Synchytrium microbalum]TPX37107.1 hypothetical protein SmJEL517_g00903 [Synchytrium microbalum]
MLKSKSFVRKTKKGTVIKIVKEHYLRDDIYCGIDACRICVEQVTPHLNKLPTANSNSCIATPHYIIPDTNIVLHQMDVLEHPAFSDVIILQTVLDELRHRSLPVYTRVRALVADQARRFYVFSNEHARETHVERLDNETPNDRNDRAIRMTIAWYLHHLQQPKNSSGGARTVVLLTNDKANREKAVAAGLLSFPLRQYVESITKEPQLVDMIAPVDESEEVTDNKRFTYDEHYRAEKVVAGLNAGVLYKGKLNITTHNSLEGSVFGRKENAPELNITIVGRSNLNRAMHGDIVAVELLPESQWKSVATELVVEEEEDEEAVEAAAAESSQQQQSASSKAGPKTTPMDVDAPSTARPSGRIVGIIKRNWRPYCGSIDGTMVADTVTTSTLQSVFVNPIDKRIPRIRIQTRQARNLLGKRILVAVDVWSRTSRYPSGHFVKTLGDAGDASTETEVVLLEYDVSYEPFTKQVNASLPVEGEAWVVKSTDFENRQDFRHIDICSIDPPGCTDIDDALHAIRLPDGKIQVGVHIADVSNFVKPGTPMDDEARARGTTVYLVDKRIDMLPSLLGTNLCSIRSDVERLAFSCIWTMTEDAEILDCVYTKSVIKSRASLTYDQAQERLDDSNATDAVSMGIKLLNSLAKKLRAKRVAAGALTLASNEVRFNLKDRVEETQDPVEPEMKELKETNALVEEFMLLANIYVAKKIYSMFPESSVLRRHPSPPSDNFDVLKKAVAAVGDFSINTDTSKTLAESLDRASKADNPYFNKLLRIVTTRCLMQAIYFCSGTIPESEFVHYGLASEIYTHFTSPIRRYADLVVHRLLAACIGYDKVYSADLTNKARVEETCENLNYRHTQAQKASRASVEIYTNRFFKGKALDREAYVIRIMKNGFTAMIPEFGVEGFVYASPKTGVSPFVYDEEQNILVAGYIQIRVFDKIKVRITIEEGDKTGRRAKMVLGLLEPVVPGLPLPDAVSSTTSPSTKRTSVLERSGKKVNR